MCRDRREEYQSCSFNGAMKGGDYCEECELNLHALQKREFEKAAVYELLKDKW